jgi:putative flippase GtrA
MRIVRYFFAGGAAALVDWSIFWLLASAMRLPYQLAAVISFVIATFTNYLLSVRFVFESGVRYSRGRETALVYVVSVIGLGINLLILQVLVAVFALHLMLAKISATAVVFLWNYFARAMLVFKPSSRA